MAALIAEGFPLKTDRHFAAYRDCIALHEEQRLASAYVEIEKMLAGLIAYLKSADWTDRW